MNINKQNLSDRFNGNESVSLKKRIRTSRANGHGVGAADFIDESNLGEPVQISLKNEDTVSHTVAVFSGSLTSVADIAAVAGEQVDAIVADGDFLKNGESVLGNLGSVDVRVELSAASAALLSLAVVIPILVYFICKKLM